VFHMTLSQETSPQILCMVSVCGIYSTSSLWRWTWQEGSETSAKHNLTPGKYPKEHIQYLKHGKSLKSRMVSIVRYSAVCSASVRTAKRIQ
jgi:hypothetical protein